MIDPNPQDLSAVMAWMEDRWRPWLNHPADAMQVRAIKALTMIDFLIMIGRRGGYTDAELAQYIFNLEKTGDRLALAQDHGGIVALPPGVIIQ